MRRPLILVIAAALAATAPLVRADPRPREIMDAARLRVALHRLQVTGSVLFVGAHPDDENTAFLSYCASGRGVRTAYLSLTRGDGGQNLIGKETGQALGVIRTQELLGARRIDGAEQFFTRALDFGFSKNSDETLEIWGRERILADVVYVIRRFQPDVIVNRFPPDARAGHGHHTASAILSAEAFRAAADPSRFPEQLATAGVWQAKRLVWNVFRPGTELRDPKLPPLITVDLGAYDPLLGRAYTEIAGLSRSMHKSQGFGAPERRGSIPNVFDHVAGDAAAGDLFDGVELTWKRAPGGDKVMALLARAERSFDPQNPAAIVPLLLEAHAAIQALPRAPWIQAKERELAETIRSAAGMWVEAVAAQSSAQPGGSVRVAVAVLNRSSLPLTLDRVELPFDAAALITAADSLARAAGAPVPLPPNRTVTAQGTVRLPADTPLSQPYWLRLPGLAGSSEVADPSEIGLPENPPVLTVRLALGLSGAQLSIDVPVVYRSVDPVQGERYRALEVAPRVTVRLDQGVYVFPDAKSREVRLTVESADSTVDRAVAKLVLPPGWRSAPAEAEVRFAAGDREKSVRFVVSPGADATSAKLSAEALAGGERFKRGLERIDHPHIPVQTLFPLAEARLVRVDIRRAGESIGYLMGSGDQVPDALRQMGFKVTLLDDDDVAGADLSRFETIVAGVRAYNTRPRLLKMQPRLLDWVAAGGRLVVQYQTPDEALVDRLGPFPFTVSRDRVTVETAPMRFVKPGHPLLVAPNRIGDLDFAGWVQERGLSFANPYDPRYETVLAANDPGEPSKEGGLLVARHGRGTFVYTGLAWFRQLPAGVPGAYRLFANLVSAPARP
jgi:LmbE family N-acetylglucosaminyl deacetylase